MIRIQRDLTRRVLGVDPMMSMEPGVWTTEFLVSLYGTKKSFGHVFKGYPWWCRGPLAPVWVCHIDVYAAWWSGRWWNQKWVHRRWMFHRLALALGALHPEEGGYYKDMRPMNPFTEEAKQQRAAYRYSRQNGYTSAWWR